MYRPCGCGPWRSGSCGHAPALPQRRQSQDALQRPPWSSKKTGKKPYAKPVATHRIPHSSYRMTRICSTPSMKPLTRWRPSHRSGTLGSPSRLRPEKSAKHGDLPDHLANGATDRFLRQNVGAFPFVGGKQCGGFEVGVSVPDEPGVPGVQPPPWTAKARRSWQHLASCRLRPGSRSEHLDEGSISQGTIQVDEAGGCRQGVGRAIGEQPLPFDQIGVGDDTSASVRGADAVSWGVFRLTGRRPGRTQPCSNAPTSALHHLGDARWWAHRRSPRMKSGWAGATREVRSRCAICSSPMRSSFQNTCRGDRFATSGLIGLTPFRLRC